MVGPLCGRVTRNQPKALPSLRVAANKRVRRVARLAGIADTGASRALRTRFLALQRIREIKSDRLLAKRSRHPPERAKTRRAFRARGDHMRTSHSGAARCAALALALAAAP